ncbi:VanZ family protein [Arthrobacter sp. DNA4]|uniref:VanZ family protein n=1 Tax=Micrococcaceae TaxID=1268 RepID=UPI0020CEEE3A|nr:MULTISPECIES: VanZ family protein [Micrococcaceae]UTT68804.1 VanZ family protein [Arthrobacter sp. DNA4]WRT13052.1 VanZ family protein [Pseudarthrobacter sp. LT1]
MVPLAFIAFWPTPVDQPVSGQVSQLLNFLRDHGIPRWVDYDFLEALANVALFLPIGFTAALAFPEKRWWQSGALGLAISGCIELGQLLFLRDRFASPSDVVTNTSGAIIGALLSALALKKRGGPLPYRRRPPRRR